MPIAEIANYVRELGHAKPPDGWNKPSAISFVTSVYVGILLEEGGIYPNKIACTADGGFLFYLERGHVDLLEVRENGETCFTYTDNKDYYVGLTIDVMKEDLVQLIEHYNKK